MLQIDDTIVSLDILEEYFFCDINKCKGHCCVEGDAGAPLEQEEVGILEELLPKVWDKLSEKSKEVINSQGVFYIDAENEPVTSIVGNGECVFTYFDENGICKCAIETACKEGRVDFLKPISCHLYPIRLAKYNDFTAVNYHKWNVCGEARLLGKSQVMPVYKFLKEPLIRKFGQDWYEKLVISSKLHTKHPIQPMR